MKPLFKQKYVTAILFLVVLLSYSFYNYITGYKPLSKAIKDSIHTTQPIKQKILQIEQSINENVAQKYIFIETYGFLQLLMGKNEVANFEVVKDVEGKLYYTYFTNGPNKVDNLADRVARLADAVEKKGTKLMYIMPPDKYIRGYTTYPKGIPYNYANETADNFLRALHVRKVDVFDLRDKLIECNIPFENLFFQTDHHWRIETAFWAFGEIVTELNNRYSIHLDPTGFYTDKQNYNFLTYPNSYLGSMGRKTGIYYAGTDDFTLVYPKFKTSYIVQAPENGGNGIVKGRFEETIFSAHAFRKQENVYETDKYFSYLKGNLPFVHIINLDKPKGPKALFIKDSMSVPFISFLSTMFSEIYLVDPRYYAEDIGKLATNLSPDFVFVSIYPPNLTDAFFPYFR